MAVLRVFAIVLAFLTLTYACLWVYVRMGERARLQAEWHDRRPPLPEFRYVANGLEATRRRLRNRLILGVYVLPLTLLAVLIWWFDYR